MRSFIIMHYSTLFPSLLRVFLQISPAVTMCTTSLTFTILRSTHTMCFVWISEQTAIISLYNINWLVCVNETECVYCAVRTGSLNIIIQFKFSGTVRLRFMVYKVTLGQVFLPVLQFPLSVSFHQCSTLQFPLSVSFHQCSTLQFPLSVSFHQCSTLQFPLSVSFHQCSTLIFI